MCPCVPFCIGGACHVIVKDMLYRDDTGLLKSVDLNNVGINCGRPYHILPVRNQNVYVYGKYALNKVDSNMKRHHNWSRWASIRKLPYTTMDRLYKQHGLQNKKQVYRTFQNATTILNFAEKEYGTHEFLKWICPLCPFRCTSCRLMSLKYLIITVMTSCNSI